MGLRNRLATLAVGSTHVLIVQAPGAWRARVTTEQEVARRGWRVAVSAADADVLLVAGAPGSQLSDRIESVWDQLPGPRSRAVVTDQDPATACTALDAVAADLLDTAQQVRDARERDGFDPESLQEADAGEGDPDSDDDMDMGDGGEMNMDMDMSPSGIPLAEGEGDRDGLEMDVLHVPLGPVLPYWPAGLVLRTTLQGDVLVAAEASVLDQDDRVPDRLGPHERAALRCDQVAGVLALAGWADGHTAAVRVRDALLTDPDTESAARLLEGLRHTVLRRWLLRWSLHGIGDLRRTDDLEPALLTQSGDVHDRLLDLIEGARTDLAGTERQQAPLPELLALAERLVLGLDLAAARLVVASLGIDTALSAPLTQNARDVLGA